MADASALPLWAKLDSVDNKNLLFGEISGVATAGYADLGDI